MVSDFWTTIGEIAEVFDGPHATPKKIDDGPFFLSISSLREGKLDLSQSAHLSEDQFVKWTRRVTPEAGDVLFSYETRLGEAALMPPNVKACLGRRMGLLRPKKNRVSSRYLLYAYLSPAFQSEIKVRTINGCTVDRIPLKELPSFPIRIPPLPEQKAIAHILGSLDDRIELNQRMNETLEAMAQALFKSWFVDFDPVIDNALASGKKIPAELSKKAQARAALGDKRQPLPEEIRTLFPDEFSFNDEMGWIPKGWEVKTINDEMDTVGGGTPSTKDPSFWEDGIHAFCTPKDMSNMTSKILTHTERLLTDKGVGKISSGQLPERTVLMSSRAPIGYLAITDVPVSINQGIIAMKTCAKYEEMFLVCWAQANMERIKERANGSTFLEISKKNFRLTPFLVPHVDLVMAFNRTMQSVLSRIISCTKNSQELSKIRDTLLPKLLSGELRIPDAEKMAAEAV